MNGFGPVCPDLNFPINQVINEIKYAFFNFLKIFGLSYVLNEPLLKLLFSHFFISKEDYAFSMCFSKHPAHIDSHKNFDALNVLEKRLYLEIAGRSKIAYYRIKSVKVLHAFNNPCELVKEISVVRIGKKFC